MADFNLSSHLGFAACSDLVRDADIILPVEPASLSARVTSFSGNHLLSFSRFYRAWHFLPSKRQG